MVERIWQNEPSRGQKIRQKLLRPLRSQEPATARMPLVERLEGTPYAIPGALRQTPQAHEASEVIELAVDMAETMLRFGAGALEAETSIIAVTSAYGLKAVDVDITNQSVTVNYAPSGEIPLHVLRVARSLSRNFMGLIQLHELVTDIINHRVDVTEARDRLRFVNLNPKPFAPWVVTLSLGVFAASILGLLGGGWVGAATAFFTSILIDRIQRALNSIRLPEFYTTSICAAVSTFIGLLVFEYNLSITPSLVITSGILSLLPAARLVSAVRDSLTGFPVTAAGRSLNVFLLFVALVSGISIGLVVGTMLGLDRFDIKATGNGSSDFWFHLLMVGVATMAIAVTEQTSRRALLPTALTAVAGYLTVYGLQAIGFGPRLSPAAAAITVGFIARVLGSRVRVPQLVLAVPAMIPLLPGLLIFQATYDITLETIDASAGFSNLFSALMVALGLAAGVVLGDYLGQHFEKKPTAIRRR